MTAASLAEPKTRERRIDRGRRSIELLLDAFFRPAHWAAKISYQLGLQGQLTSTTSVVRLSRLPRRQVPLRIAFASDFHAGVTTDDRLLARACEALDRFEPDVLLLGGDFVSVRASYIDGLAPHLAAIRAPSGKFAVLGNHDLRADSGRVVEALEATGVRVLINERATLPEPFAGISICGLDDPTRGVPRADLALDGADGADGARIVLMHSPEGLRAIGDRQFDLALCGHTHGGQVALPWGAPILLPSGRLNRRYCNGRYNLECEFDRTLLVSRGVGCSTVPVRAFAAPEVHLCLIV